MVSGFLFKNRDGQTPLPLELQKGLKIKTIQTIGELDEFEEQNIAKGKSWLSKQKGDPCTYNFWIKLHTGEEISARFHERIETIHPFANGNGRFGRILTEKICMTHVW